jgi:hypothetical protein
VGNATEHITLNHPTRAAIIAQIERRGGKPSKYRNEKAEADGIVFASKREARRYRELRLEEKAGRISDLRLQVRYPLTVNGQIVCYYLADFVYRRDGQETVEDVKSEHTKRIPVYRLKKRLMSAIYNIEILET